ncbi:MAG: ABC transporter ATP-binding protein/permease, partial [Candidatus Eremiobacterota bacterium]
FINVMLRGRIIDDAIGKQRDLTLLFKYILAYFIIMVMSMGLSYLTGYLFMRVSQKTLIRLRTDLYNHILKLNIGFFHKTPVGEIMSRLIPEVQQLGIFLSQIILVPLSAVMNIISGLIMITAIEWRMGCVAFGIFCLIFIFLPSLRAGLKALTKKWSEKMRNISKQTEESISHYMEIQTNNTFPYEEYNFYRSLMDFFGINLDIAKVNGKTTFLSQFFSGLATLSVYGVGGFLVIKHWGEADGLTVGSLVIMTGAIANIINPVNTLIDFSQRYQEALVKFDMVSDYLNIPQEMTDGKDSRELDKISGEIHINNLFFGFEQAKKILKNINLHINSGEHIAFVGPAGCGKSTMSLLINRLTKPQRGEIKLDGINISDIRLDSLRKHIGYVAQAKTSNPGLFGGTVADNIIYSLKTGHVRGEKEEWVNMKSIGINTDEELRHEILEVVKDVDFYDDIFNFGLKNVTLLDVLNDKNSIFSISDAQNFRKRIIEGREKFRNLMTEHELVEFFDTDKFMTDCTIMENIIFTSCEPFTKDRKSYEILKNFLYPLCEKTGLQDRIFYTGCTIAAELSDICKKVKNINSDIMRKIRLPQPLVKDLVKLGERFRIHGMETVKKSLKPEEKEHIFRLGYEYSAGYGIGIYLDDDFIEKILLSRRLFKKTLSPELKEKIIFYDRSDYIDGATIRDNIIMGKINTVINRAEEKISSILKKVIEELDLEQDIVNMGLLMDIGERGSKLSGGQAQKTAIARVLLKKPSILILDEATSALDNASHQKINKMIMKKFKDKTVITIAHRLDTIKDYDRIIVFKGGEIVETGAFNELLEKKGLFCRLWETFQVNL